MVGKKRQLGAHVRGDGVLFMVWAPFAKFVSVVISSSTDAETPLERDDDGYWSGFVKGARAGQSYHYHLQTPYDEWIDKNDPYARQLTTSDGGESVITESGFDWEDDRPVARQKNEQVIYELHVGTFNRPDAATPGTFDTVIDKLDYLQRLGITTIELMPITAMAASHGWGYAPNHLFAVESSYGGRHGLLKLVKAAHSRDIAVIVDVVYNHFSEQTDLWQFDGWNEAYRGGIYFYNDERGETPWGGRPDYGRPEVRQFILDNVAMWLSEYHVDGLRLDSTVYMRNTKGANDDPAHDLPDAWSLFQGINKLAHEINPQALMIAEDCSLNDYITKPAEDGGAGFDAQWGTAFPLAIRSRFGMDSHDYSGRLEDELQHTYNGDAFAKVIFSDSHDTAANGGSRLNEATTPGNPRSVFARQRLLLANALTFTAPGIPMLLQGEEFMQQGAFNDWQMLQWENVERFNGVVQAYTDLIRLRRNVDATAAGLSGSLINVFHSDSANNVLAFHRWQNGGPGDDVIVIVNFSDIRFKNYELGLPVAGTWRVIFNSSFKGYSSDFNQSQVTSVTTNEQQRITVELADYNVLILAQE